MPYDWKQIYFELDSAIRAGHGHKARASLLALAKEKIPREFIVPFSQLSLRADLPHFGLRLLRPYVYSDRKRIGDSNAGEKLSYAALLDSIGAHEEALLLLQALDANLHPLVHFQRAFIHIARWEYRAAIPLLLKYLDSELPPYKRLVANMNLAASLVHERRFQQAESVLEEILSYAISEKLAFAHGKALQLKAENYLLQKKWDKVEQCLQAARDLIQDKDGMDDFFIRKLELQFRFELSKGNAEILHKIRLFQREAREKKHWESVRDCDRTIAIVTRDAELMKKLYFGTPFRSFRERLVEDFGKSVDLSGTFSWEVQEGDDVRVLDLTGHGTGEGSHRISHTHLLYKVLSLLASDFYRPTRVAALHYHLHPRLNFDAQTSRPKIHRAITRLRSWLDEAGIPLSISENEEYYGLVALGPCSIQVGTRSLTQVLDFQPLKILRDKFPEKPFSTTEASKSLHKPVRTIRRILVEATEDGILERDGNGPSSRYTFKKLAG